MSGSGARRLFLRIATLVAAVSLLALTPLLPAPTADADRTFGDDPLSDVLYWANQEKACGLTTNRLAALMLAPTWPETGAPATVAPSPMTLSRSDNQSGLHSFGQSSSYRDAFWHPGIGAWQLDGSGFATTLTASQRMDTFVGGAQVAATVAARWCTTPTLSYALAPWWACNSGQCQTIYSAIYNSNTDQLNALGVNGLVGSLGGTEQSLCSGPGQSGTFPCWRVDPGNAEGHTSWRVPAFGPSPISAPFYVYTAGGLEYRHWLTADTGYGTGIWATRPLGSNPRTNLTWHTGQPLTDHGVSTLFSDVSPSAWYIDDLQWAVDEEIITGYPDGTYKPKSALNRGQMIVWLWKLSGEPDVATAHGFVDIAPGAWTEQALDWADSLDLVEGYPDGTYRPTEELSRAQASRMWFRFAGEPSGASPAGFSDVTPGSWYSDSVDWLAATGIITGFPDGTFRGDELVNRGQAVAWLNGLDQTV